MSNMGSTLCFPSYYGHKGPEWSLSEWLLRKSLWRWVVKNPNQALLCLLEHMPGQLNQDLVCCEKNPFTVDILKGNTLRCPYSFVRCCTTRDFGFTILGKALVCFVLSLFEMWALGGLVTVLASPAVECTCGWSLRGRGEFTDILIHIPGLAFHLICTAGLQERETVINVPPLAGRKLAKLLLCLHLMCVCCEFCWVWVYEVPAQPQRWEYKWQKANYFRSSMVIDISTAICWFISAKERI